MHQQEITKTLVTPKVTFGLNVHSNLVIKVNVLQLKRRFGAFLIPN